MSANHSHQDHTADPLIEHDPPHFHDDPEIRDLSKEKRLLLISFLLITFFMLVEAIGGLLTHSLALLSDAGHMLSDAAALGATLLAFKIGEKQASDEKTFGYKRFEILVAGANGATLIIISVMIVWEAIDRFTSPPEVASHGMLIIATIGLIVNLVVAWLLHSGSNHHHHDDPLSDEKNLNMHSAYLHVLGDLLGSVAAIVAALAMIWMDWWWADPVASIIVAVLILVSGYRVVKASAHILMEGTPEEISLSEVEQTILGHKDIIAVHDLHVWSITSGLHALSCHVVVDSDMRILEASELIHSLELSLEKLGISHTTIQVESVEHPHNRLEAIVCSLEDAKRGNHSHGHHHHH
ncbi:cation diffusion facilitator family transporter [Psychrobacter lutiphocae]|uniref:cation diffusion facilitator family transporter n=1 Tax=Psychrobacter lutiphocae TaxID=540500 RepID=UPI00035C4036|nr:cation diffusion facilitator family transporter [Psychrobacter lutiphocae]